jgi:hypothetical protein
MVICRIRDWGAVPFHERSSSSCRGWTVWLVGGRAADRGQRDCEPGAVISDPGLKAPFRRSRGPVKQPGAPGQVNQREHIGSVYDESSWSVSGPFGPF